MVHASEYEALNNRSVARLVQTGADPRKSQVSDSASAPYQPGRSNLYHRLTEYQPQS